MPYHSFLQTLRLMMRCALFLFLIIEASPIQAQEEEGLFKIDSPDGKFLVATRTIPDSAMVWRKDLDSTRLVLIPLIIGSYEAELDLDHLLETEIIRRIPDHLKWTDDSKFIVFSTFSSGGHSPWNDKTFVIDIAKKSWVRVDDGIGSVVSPDFLLTSPHTAVFQVLHGDTEHSISKRIDLETLFDGSIPKLAVLPLQSERK